MIKVMNSSCTAWILLSLMPRMHNSCGDRSFGAAGPRIWNSLPCGLRTLDISYNILKHYQRHICLTRPRRFVTFYISALEILLLTYLLTYLLIYLLRTGIQQKLFYNAPGKTLP